MTSCGNVLKPPKDNKKERPISILWIEVSNNDDYHKFLKAYDYSAINGRRKTKLLHSR